MDNQHFWKTKNVESKTDKGDFNFVTDTSKSKQEINRINEIISLWKFNHNALKKEREYQRSIATFGSIETILSLNQYNVKVELQ